MSKRVALTTRADQLLDDLDMAINAYQPSNKKNPLVYKAPVSRNRILTKALKKLWAEEFPRFKQREQDYFDGKISVDRASVEEYADKILRFNLTHPCKE